MAETRKRLSSRFFNGGRHSSNTSQNLTEMRGNGMESFEGVVGETTNLNFFAAESYEHLAGHTMDKLKRHPNG